MQLAKITSDHARTIFLARASAAVAADLATENTHAVTAYADQMNRLKSALAETVTRENEAFVVRRRMVRTRDELIEVLIRCVRDFWNTLQRRNLRQSLAAELLDYYSMPSTLPKDKDPHTWVLLGKNLLKGEARAVEKGVPPMANPDVEELTGCMEGAEEACNGVGDADREHAHIQEELVGLRQEVDQLARSVAASLRIILSDQEPSKRRRIMRAYGFSFTNQTPEDLERDNEDLELSEEPMSAADVQTVDAQTAASS